MTILEVEDQPVESALQQRLRRVPTTQREAMTGSFQPVLGRRIFAFDILPPRHNTPEQRRQMSINIPA